jgi:acyl-CoA thioesterase FadM
MIPPFPQDTPRAQARVHLRFEDVTQDGRLVLEALPNALGPTVWRGILASDPATRACIAQGIVPILSRFVLEGRPGPFSANEPVEAEGTCRLARAEDGRFVLDMWADLTGAIGRTYPAVVAGPPPRDRAGEKGLAGRILAEHVLTRPFAPAGERRVTSLDFPGAPRVTATRPASPAYDAIASVPADATPLEPRKSADPVPVVFGLVHTDSNMHVNSLAYLRLFEEAALRRFAELGRESSLLGRQIDIVYRKPCFAGQTMRVALQAFEHEGRLGVSAALVEQGDGTAEQILARGRPHTFAQMIFEP